VRPSNTRAIGLYRKLGYNFHSERGSEILIMTRPLQIGPQPLPSPL
jgi:ribosomal protein S18 acetylase RimI-like enzyme